MYGKAIPGISLRVEGVMHDIFLSYAGEDRSRASQLADALGKLGWRVWWDRTILPGKTFDKVIESELNAATCVIVLWSKTSVESQWVRAEAGEALNDSRLIPVLLEDVVIPLVFRQIQAASLLDWDGNLDHAGFTQLTLAIKAFVEPSRINDEHPDTGASASQPETAEAKPPDRQPDALPESPQPSGQSKSGGRSASLFWPAATISALFIAGLSIYLNWQKPAETGTPVTAEIPSDQVIQAKRSDPDDEIPAAVKPAVPRVTKTKPAINKEGHQPSAMQASTEPPEPETATEPKPAPKPKPAPRVTPPKLPQAKPARTSPRVVNTRPAAPPADTPVTTIAKTIPPKTVAPKPPPAPVKILMVVWGTPNDDGLASPIPTREYSGKLAQLMTGVIKDAIRRPAKFDYRYIKDRNHHSLMRDNPKYKQSSALCSETGVDLLIVGFVEGAEWDDTIGFLPTRPPYFSVFQCKSGKGAAKRFEVAGTLGDSFPYEQSLTRVFRSFARQELLAVGDLR